jgi:hypothetical protein
MFITTTLIFCTAWVDRAQLLSYWVGNTPLIYARRNRDWLTALIILTFAIAWITEIYFDRSLGGMLTGFFIPFLLTDNGKFY